MNFDGNAPQHSAFAIVAIESVWPNPDGNEIPPDTYDLDLLREAGKGDYNEQIGQGSYERSGFQVLAANDEASYQAREGYYKILPLNVIKVDTRATREGSEFTLSFTLDDLLLVTDSNVDSLNATGLPMQTRDLVHLGDSNSLPVLVGDEHRSNWEYKQDSELGLSRYKINGASSSFNIEDLVSPNDTVTIWIYHDPSDFYLKDEIPTVLDDADLHINDEIKNVVGSADRRNQFSDDNTSFEEYMLTTLGLVNRYIGENITTARVAEDVEEVILGVDEIQDALRGIISEGVNDITVDATYLLRQSSDNFFKNGHEPLGVISAAYVYDNLIEPYFDPLGMALDLSPSSTLTSPTLENLPEGDDIERLITPERTLRAQQVDTYDDPRITRLSNARQAFDRILAGFDLSIDGQFSVPEDPSALREDMRKIPYYADYYGERYAQGSLRGVTINEFYDAELEEIAAAATILKDVLEKKAAAYVRDYIKNKSVITAEQRFSHGRKVLINDFSGETPYLALKGKIANISVSVGTAASTHTVTLGGQGYEKTLNESEIFYEDMLYPSATVAPQAEYMSSYGLMTPPRAIVDIVNRYAAKQVVLGSPTDFTQAAYQTFLQLSLQLNSEDVVEGDPGERIDTSKLENAGVMRGKIPLRGSFILSKFTTEANMEDLRLFHPVNYIDTTRVSEMSRILDRSYEVPQGEAVINNAVFLTTRTSLMDNLKAVGGVAEFYELFVDETGRLRYRLSFEAIERTPKPSITPIVQDETLLSGASFTKNDALVKTMVDVRPITGQHNINYLDLGFVGRSVADQGAIPIKNATDKDGVNIEDAIAPDLYRYGLRSLQIQDIYTSETRGAIRKAHLYRLFYEKPLKQAHVNILNNTSYRVGDTALVVLQRNKHRSRTLINLQKTRDWLNYIGEHKDLLDMYVGVDERLLMTDSYVPTASSYSPIHDENMYKEFVSAPKQFVLNQFIKTFDYLIETLPGVNVITPDYFPPTYWYFDESDKEEKKGNDFYHWDEGTLLSTDIVKLYTNALRAALMNRQVAADALGEMFDKHPGIIQALKFQDFRAASYYIDSVSHKFAHGKDATTQLALNYGQDNLVLLEPKRSLPIGFISIEKRMRIGYDSPVQQDLFFEGDQRSALQTMYLEQFREESEFRSASFMYRAQEFRNASNYMHSLARREGLNTDINIESSVSTEVASSESPVDELLSEEGREINMVIPGRNSDDIDSRAFNTGEATYLIEQLTRARAQMLIYEQKYADAVAEGNDAAQKVFVGFYRYHQTNATFYENALKNGEVIDDEGEL